LKRFLLKGVSLPYLQASKQGWFFCRQAWTQPKEASAFLEPLLAQGLRHTIMVFVQRSLHASETGCAKARPDNNNKKYAIRKTMGLLSVQTMALLCQTYAFFTSLKIMG
jgi:hypothetical protein